MVRKPTKSAPKKPAAKVVDIARARRRPGAGTKATTPKQELLTMLRDEVRRLERGGSTNAAVLITIRPSSELNAEGDAVDWGLMVSSKATSGELFATIGLLEATKMALLETIVTRQGK